MSMSHVDVGLDPSECEREPIRIPGSIQPHGVLLTLHPDTLIVAQIAGDTLSLFGLTQDALLNRSLTEQHASPLLTQLAAQLASSHIVATPPSLFHVREPHAALDATVHVSDGLLVVEIQRPAALAEPEATALMLVQRMASAVRGTSSLQDLLQCMAVEVQQACGFDRVMIYQFDQDGHGHVAAERCSRQDIEPFMGLHYPASDIPQQARALYLKNWLRCIPDVGYLPLPITPTNNPLTGEPLDLTYSVLRSVSPVHLQYLAHMGVVASMSVSIVVDGALWGLIACHHYAARMLDSRLRTALELFAQLASLQLATSLQMERTQRNIMRRKIQDNYLTDLQAAGFAQAFARNADQLLELVSAQGVVMRIDDATFCHGLTPTTQLETLMQALEQHASKNVFATDRLTATLPVLGISTWTDISVAGMLAIAISNSSDFIIWFLPELAVNVKWAGNPDYALHRTDGKLAPRKSFAAWKELVLGRSRAWEADELDAATRLRSALREITSTQGDEAVKELSAMHQRQELIMAELDHRVKNILATIQSLVRFSSKSADSLASYTQALEKRLVSMARAHDLLTSSRWTGASLHRLIMEELSAFCPPGSTTLQLSGDDVALTPATALSLSLLLHELATNAAKYGCLSVPGGQLSIHNERVESDTIRIQWIERNGPPVMTPSRRGFGRLLLEKVFANDVSGGGVSLAFEKAGVRCLIDLPAARLVAGEQSELPTTLDIAAPDTSIVRGQKVLVVGNSGLVALDIADILNDAGATVIGPFQLLQDAMQAADEHSFDVALLDVSVNGSAVWPLARLIRQRGLPIVLATGSSASQHPEELQDAVVLRKPYDSDTLLHRLAFALSSHVIA